jgi:signal transduction histidine kinase/Tfp pilus assembly protein PilF
MNKYILAVIFIFASIKIVAQAKQVDSLLRVLETETADSNKVRLYNRIGNYYMYNNPGKAIQYFENALSIAKVINRPLAIANNHYSIGFCYLSKGDYDESLKNYLESVKVYESLKDSFRLSNALMSIANVYSSNKDFKNTNDYHNRALQIIESLKDSLQLFSILDSKGTVLDQQKQYDSALTYLQKSYNIAEAIKDNYSIIGSLSNIGLTYKHKEKTDLALQYFEKALELAKKEEDMPDRLAALYNNIGAANAQAGNIALAKIAFNKSIEYGKSAGSVPLEMENYRNLSDMYGNVKDYAQQTFFLKKYYALKDSLFTTDNKNQLTELEADYKIEKKNTEIIKKEGEVEKGKNQRNLFILLSGGMVLLLGGLGFFYSRIKNKNTLLAQQNIQINKQKDELETLNGVKDRLFSIISHDLRNPLVTLRSYLSLSDNVNISDDKKIAFKKQTSQAVSQTTDMLDNLLVWANMQIKNTNANIAPVDIEEVVLDAMDNVQAQAEQKNISIHKNIEVSSALGDKNILNIALRNLLTNAIKYSGENKNIFISSIQKDNQVLLSVKDEGIGMTTKQIADLLNNETETTKGTQGEKGSGLGLFLVKELLTKANNKLIIESEEGKGTTFTIGL